MKEEALKIRVVKELREIRERINEEKNPEKKNRLIKAYARLIYTLI